MKNMGDIRHSMRAISDTEQITKAMHLISTSKMKRAVSNYEKNRYHFDHVQAGLKDILAHSSDLSHPYVKHSEGGSAAFVVIAGDKGLCGGYNHNVLNFALAEMKKNKQQYILTVGQEARAFFERKGYMIDVEFLHIAQNPSLANARNITNDILELYDSGVMDEVYVVYTKFYSPLRQEPHIIQLLPVEESNFEDIETEYTYSADLSFHPSVKEVFDRMVPQYIIGLMYGCLVQAYASEHSARMTAMENATQNADEMLAKLSLEYNRARQFNITTEISEIIGAMEALSDSF